DPRYGLSGEALKHYYRTKPAEWAIYCWDRPGTQETRRPLLADQKRYVGSFGERVVGYGHFVSDDGRETLGTSFFMQLDDRATADKFIADAPLNKAGVYQHVGRNSERSKRIAPPARWRNTRRSRRYSALRPYVGQESAEAWSA